MAVARTLLPETPTRLSPDLAEAVEALSQGEAVLLYDAPDREGEVDLVYLAEKVSPDRIRALRQDAGGLIVVTIPEETREALGLPYLADLLRGAGEISPLLPRLVPERFRYDQRSAFGISVNHRECFTGIPDLDRALTVKAVGELVRDQASLSPGALKDRFALTFLSPGHVPVLYSAPRLVRDRRGHTELSSALARMGGLTPSLVLCEMLGEDGRALSLSAARDYARSHRHPLVEGRRIVEAWSRWSG